MKRLTYIVILVWMCAACKGSGQSRITYVPDTAALGRAFEMYREPTLIHRRFKHADIEPLILKRRGTGVFEVSQLGNSVLRKPIYQLKYGDGPKKVMLWSQMHGNEPTATMALMDLFNFLEGSDHGMDTLRHLLRTQTSLYFIPMLNPDGADVYTRRNAMDIDLNRDARVGQTAEGQLLIRAAATVKPHYGFNLHDMNIYYNVPGTRNPVTIALLAPAYNEEREVNEVRGNAMKIAAGINHILQGYIPDGVAKYDDTFSPRSFGDNFQRWGASTVLIESGGYKGDPEKQFIRKLNFIIILNSLVEIALDSYHQYGMAKYESLPFSVSQLADLVLRKVGASRDSMAYKIDLSVKRSEHTVDRDFYVQASIADVGDLQDVFGYDELDAEGYHFMPGKVCPQALKRMEDMSPKRAMDLLRQGYFAIQVEQIPEVRFHSFPLVIFHQRKPLSPGPVLGGAANFFLARDGRPVYAVVNGYLIDLAANEPPTAMKNYIF